MLTTTRIKAWPFLIGKNRQPGYRVVVAPDFLVAAHIPGVLDQLRANHLIEKPITRVLKTEEVGELTVFYRVVNISKEGKIYTDFQNRPILWTEGLVIQGRYPDLVMPANIFHAISKEIEQIADNFFQSEDVPKIVVGKPLEIDLSANDLQNPEAICKRLQQEIYKLRDQEKLLQDQISEIEQKINKGKNIALIGIPLVLIVVGVVIIPVGLWMYYDGSKELQNPEAMIKTVQEQIEKIEIEIALLSQKQGK